MIKYTRKQINKDAQLHDKEFVTVDEVTELMGEIVDLAIKSGADENKMMEFFKDE